MQKITRLEWTCLIITATVLSVMSLVLIRRQQEVVQDPDDGSAGDDLQQLAQHVPSRTTVQDADSSPTEVDGAFLERVRDVPRPDAAPRTLPDTNMITMEVGPLSNAVAGPVRPPRVFGTNEVMMALSRVASMPWGPESEQLLQATVSKWAATDPSAALDYALGIESRRVRAALLNNVFTTWAKTDFKGAYSWLVANRESAPDTFRLGLKPVIAAAAASSVPQAMLMAMELGAGADRLAAMGVVLGYASRSGVMPTMVAYMDSLQTAGERRSYASLLAQNWAYYAPEQAAGWAMSLSDPQLKSAALATAVSTWAGDNPAAAAAWVTTVPDTELRSQQMAQITQTWAKYDPVKAADWLLSLRPPSTSLDPAVRSLVGTIMTSSPEVAVMWAGTIADPKLRNSTIMSVARQWMKNDPQKASSYIATAPLSPAQRTSLLRTRR